jgi:hypothetical protein
MKTEYFIIISLSFIIYIINSIKKKQLSIEESLVWFLGTIVALFLSIFPKSFDSITKVVGISYPPSLFFLLCILFLMFNNFRHSKKVAKQQEQIINLSQEIAILKGKSNNEK